MSSSELAKVAEIHPDWQKVSVSREFNDWLKDQPPERARLAGSMKAADAIYLLNKFKERGMANYIGYGPSGENMSHDEYIERQMMAERQRQIAMQQNFANQMLAGAISGGDSARAQKATPPEKPKHLNNKLLLTVKG